MTFKPVKSVALLVLLVMGVSAMLAIFVNVTFTDLRVNKNFVDGGDLNAVKPGDLYAYHLEQRRFEPTKLCTMIGDPISEDDTTFIVSHQLGATFADSISFIKDALKTTGGVSTGQMFGPPEFQPLQNTLYQREFPFRKSFINAVNNTKGGQIPSDCAARVSAFLNQPEIYAVFRVEQVFRDKSADLNGAAAMVGFALEPLIGPCRTDLCLPPAVPKRLGKNGMIPTLKHNFISVRTL